MTKPCVRKSFILFSMTLVTGLLILEITKEDVLELNKNLMNTNTHLHTVENVNTEPIKTCSMETRLAHVKRICAKRNVNKQSDSLFTVDPEHRVSFCPIEKVASSTWKRFLAVSTKTGKTMSKEFYGHSEKELNDRGILDRQKLNKTSIYTNYSSFIIVRHPLVRLLSAYYDKMARKLNISDPQNDYSIQRRLEIHNTVHATEVDDRNLRVSLKDFVMFVFGECRLY